MIVGLGQAADLVTKTSHNATDELLKKTEHLVTLLKQKCSIQINFESSPRLPNTASICFNGVQSTLMLEKCKDQIEFSKSAACHSGIVLV